MEILKSVNTKVFDPNAIPVGTCVRLTTRDNSSVNALVCGYGNCDSVMMAAYSAEPPATDVKWVTITAKAVVEGITKIEPLVAVPDIKLEDTYNDHVDNVANPMTVKQFKEMVNSIPEYLDNSIVIIAKKKVVGTKLQHTYTQATDCIYYDDEVREYGGLLLELC